MRRTAWRATTAALVTALLAMSGAAAQDRSSPDRYEEIEAGRSPRVALASPGDHHRHLDRFVGVWKGEITMWMAPDAEPASYEAVAEARWILGGRYLEWRHSGLFDGTPFQGVGIDGFNNGMNRYESIWIDNFGTLILYYTGSCSDGGLTKTLEAEFADPASGVATTQRVVYRWTEDDRFTYESFISKGNDEFRSMLIEYERQ